jgi:hypothetical protein
MEIKENNKIKDLDWHNTFLPDETEKDTLCWQPCARIADNVVQKRCRAKEK